ncbi:MAG: T9SS type A sorting domain-containing protein [Bacteroidetes bacterium]|nr:T9SS type A sorting domain-containing protein [Bacteroidota bacterium]
MKSYKFHLNGDLPAKSVVRDGQSLLIYYSIDELNLEAVETENGLFYRVTIPGHTPTYSEGKPELPVLSRLIMIPEGADFKIKISDVKSTRLHPSSKKIKGLLYPAQESESKSAVQRKKEFRIDRELYASKNTIPADTIIIEPLGTLRNNRLYNISIKPARYNPRTNSLEVITSMKVEISNIVSAGSKSESLAEESVLFTESLEKSVINYDSGDVIPGFSDKPVKMIILTDTTFKKLLIPFIKWKTQKGFDVKVLYRGKKYAGDTYTEIKTTLANIYNTSTPKPEYLLIIGDTKRIPYYGTGSITDMYYGEFDGNGDYIPEMYIGRLPVSDTTQLKNVLDKVIQYEQYKFASTNTFHSRALVTGGTDASNIKIINGQVYYGITNYLTSANKLTGYHFYYDQALKLNAEDSIRKLTRRGLSFINYTGHGDASGWLDPTLKSGDLDTVTNTNMYPFIISNACQTSTFSNASTFGNKMVLAGKKGAIGFIGGSADTYWDEDFYWAVGPGTITNEPTYAGTGLGAYDRLFHTHSELPSDWYVTMGQVMFAGNMAVSASSTTKKKYYWEIYNLVGDPSVSPIIGKPDTFSIHLPDTLPNGIKSLSLTEKPFAYFAVSHSDTLWDASHASPSGAVELTMPGLSNDSCLLVVTGQNTKPLIKTIYFGSVSKEYINLSDRSINDLMGNNNKVADLGETFYLSIKAANLGNTVANNVYAKISSSSGYITILNDSTYLGNLAARSEITVLDKLEIKVSRDVTDLSVATIILKLGDDATTKQYTIDITLHSPDLQVLSCTMNDSLLGNGNFIADPGEKFSLIYKVQNKGTSDASGDFSVSTPDPEKITILDQNVKSGILRFGQVTEIPVTVQLADLVANGSYFNVSSSLSCDPYIINNNFTFRVGRIRESFEAESFNVFPWINYNKVPWITTGVSSYDGGISARSGAIGNSSSSSLMIKTYYNSSDSVKFMYKVSSELNYDYFYFLINDKEVLKKSGETGWIKFSVAVKAGLNKFEWIYRKDANQSGGNDCAWIDMIDFATTGSLRYIQKDLQVAKVLPLPAKNKYSYEPIIVKLLNVGKDTIKSFNLAYRINDRSVPVQQLFNTKVVPFGDTVTVEFTEKVNFYRYGLYKITSYALNNGDDYLRNDTASFEFRHELTDSLIIYPNPFTEQFTIYINSKYSETIRITINNSAGSQVYEMEKNITAGKNPVIISAPWLSPSVYYVNIRTNRGFTTLRVIKTKK